MISIDTLGIDFFFNGFENVEKAEKVKEVVNGILQGLGKLTGAAAGVYKVGDAVRDFVVKMSGLKDASESSGITVEKLELWSRAIKVVGGDANDFVSSMNRLTTSLQESLIEGGPMLSYFSELGVDVRKSNGELRDTTDILYDLAGKWEKWTPSQRNTIGQKLGLNESTIKLLQRGQQSLGNLLRTQAEFNMVTEEQAQLSREISELWNEITVIWSAASDVLMAEVLPMLKVLFTYLRDISAWVVKNKPVLYGLITGIATVLGTILLPVLAKVAIAWVAAFAPVLAVIGIIALLSAAIYVLIDDYIAWKTGNASALGEIWEKFDNIIGAIKNLLSGLGNFLKDFWKDPKKVWSDTVDYFRNRWKDLTLVEIFKDLITTGWNSFKTTWDELFTPFLLAIDDTIKKYFGFSLVEEGDKLLRSFWDGLKQVWEDIKAWVNGLFGDFKLYDKGKKLAEDLAAGFLDTFKSPTIGNALDSALSAIGLGEERVSPVGVGMAKYNTDSAANDIISPATAVFRGAKQTPFNVQQAPAAAFSGGQVSNNNVSAPVYVGGVTIKVENGDPKNIVSGMNNAIRQEPPMAWNFDGPIKD